MENRFSEKEMAKGLGLGLGLGFTEKIDEDGDVILGFNTVNTEQNIHRVSK